MYGKTEPVLVEEIVDGKAVGYTPNYLRVYFDGDENDVGKIVNVIVGAPYLDGANGTAVYAKK